MESKLVAGLDYPNIYRELVKLFSNMKYAGYLARR